MPSRRSRRRRHGGEGEAGNTGITETENNVTNPYSSPLPPVTTTTVEEAATGLNLKPGSVGAAIGIPKGNNSPPLSLFGGYRRRNRTNRRSLKRKQRKQRKQTRRR